MIKRSIRLCSPIVVSLLSALSLSAATYHVDFVGGNDTADGLSPKTAWKHSPGDPNATDKPQSAALMPGDTILFKGGVTYHGSIKLATSGAPDKPITLDGNTAGTFGEGRAIIDGGKVIDQWKRCQSAGEAQGNPRWKDLFYADLDLDISANFNHGEVVLHRQVPPDKQAPWQRVILYDGASRLLPIAQSPKPSDSFYPDIPGDFLVSTSRIATVEGEAMSSFVDDKNLTGKTADYYDGMFVGLHGGNNHVYFAAVQKYDPANHQLFFAPFKATTYPETRFAFYNSVRLIDLPGEWAILPSQAGKTRVYLLPDRLENDQPVNIGFPVFETGIAVDGGASHLRIQGFLIQRFAGGAGGVSVTRNNPRATNITVANNEIRFVSGHAGVGLNFCDNVTVENCYIHHCPGWTTAIFISRVNDFAVTKCRLDKNSGSGIRHYEAKRGKIHDNAILNHYGMHSSTINVYEGCEDLAIERNYMHNVIAINRNAENIAIRQNVLDGQGKSAVNIALWNSGKTGGTSINNVLIEKNTLINASLTANHASSVFAQTGKNVSPPEGIVIKNNVLDRLRPPLAATIENNIFMRETETSVAGSGSMTVTDPAKLFLDPAKGDYRRRPGGPLMEAGADLPPPSATWEGN